MKILIHGRAFPVAMWRWFDWSLRDVGHEVFSVGSYQGDFIPWGEGIHLPKYDFPPDFVIPEMDMDGADVLRQVREEKGFVPDVVIQAADTIALTGRIDPINILIETDPHAVDYTERVKDKDYVFSMQKYYAKEGDRWLPYAYYPAIHKNLHKDRAPQVMFSGLQYDHRIAALEAMKQAGIPVVSTLGLVYDDYVEAYNNNLIAFNWSSKQDLPARFWEGLAMGSLVLTNRVPDLEYFPDLIEDRDYVAFSSIEEAVEKAKYYTEHIEEAETIAHDGWQNVQKHTYQNRVREILTQGLVIL